MLNKKKQEKVRGSVSAEQLGEFLVVILRLVVKVVKTLDSKTIQYWIGHERELLAGLKKVFVREPEALDEKLADWVKFYHEVFGLELDPANIALPPERDGFGWLVLVAKGLTRNQVFTRCTQRFKGKTWRYYDDLNRTVTENDRESDETYAIRVRDRVEADECYMGKSANVTIDKRIKGITNLERMLLELWYHWKNNDHLDKETLTICAGSRYADGSVPHADWGSDRFNVGGVHPVAADDDWRVREVVSL